MRARGRTWAVAMIGLVGAGIPALAPSTAHAAPPPAGMSARERDRQVELATLLNDAQGSAADLRRALARHHFRLVSTGVPAPRSARTTTPDNVTMYTPKVVFDTTYHRYTASASYTWEGWGWETQTGLAEKDVGGPDGFGMRFDHNLTNNGVTATFRGRPVAHPYFGATVLSTPSDNGPKGVGWRLQDKIREIQNGSNPEIDYNMYRGTITMDVGRPACGTTVRIYSRYSHTWSSTSLVGFDISLTGFGMSWNTTSGHWEAANPTAGQWTPC